MGRAVSGEYMAFRCSMEFKAAPSFMGWDGMGRCGSGVQCYQLIPSVIKGLWHLQRSRGIQKNSSDVHYLTIHLLYNVFDTVGVMTPIRPALPILGLPRMQSSHLSDSASSETLAAVATTHSSPTDAVLKILRELDIGSLHSCTLPTLHGDVNLVVGRPFLTLRFPSRVDD